LVKIYRSVNNPHLASVEMVRAFIENQGILIRGDNEIAETPKAAKEILGLSGYSLDFVVKGLNNFSNNYIADMLLKRLGSAFPASGQADQPGSGTERSGLKVLERYLKNEVGIKSPYTLMNASGLSFENRLSASQVNQVLLRMAKSLDVFPEFFASLPAAGRDGTLKKRFQNDSQSLASNIRAKTGTLTSPRSVSSLAGYVKTPKDGLLVFTIIGNGLEGKAQPGIADLHRFQDKLVSLLASGEY
jgi:D-alanyl-D-alanine carboxypeptidase/D-alanyl-D-alanine-endopeptidase (penicillin-binding protein 4)